VIAQHNVALFDEQAKLAPIGRWPWRVTFGALTSRVFSAIKKKALLAKWRSGLGVLLS